MVSSSVTEGKDTKPYIFASYVGPQVPGGVYYCGYWNKRYEVTRVGTSIEWRDGVAYPSNFWIEVKWEGEGRKSIHCTAWDAWRDKVISVPASSDLLEVAA